MTVNNTPNEGPGLGKAAVGRNLSTKRTMYIEKKSRKAAKRTSQRAQCSLLSAEQEMKNKGQGQSTIAVYAIQGLSPQRD